MIEGHSTTGSSAPIFIAIMVRLSRRQVIKTLALGGAFSNVIGRSWAASMLYDLQSTPDLEEGLLSVRLADFPELNEPNGSIRIGTSPVIPHDSGEKQTGLFAPVIINRSESGDFYVLSAECMHEGCTVRRLDPDSQLMICGCHGSQYAVDGTVVQGPALQSLRTLNFTRTDESLTIEMPGVFFEITSQRITSEARIGISFIAFSAITYEIFFRERLDGPPTRVSFATTPEGPIDQTEIHVEDDYALVYVERPGRFGFFQIAMKPLVV